MRIVVSGGGTGGHIYPALATVKQLKQLEPETEVLYIGGERGLEKSIVPEAGFDFKALAVQGFSRSLSLDNVKTVYLFLTATRKAKKMLEDFKPDVVVGTGGYVSGPVLYAAQQLKIPTVIHEQNSVVGVTNKFLARHVTKVGVAFPAALPPARRFQPRKSRRAAESLRSGARAPHGNIFHRRSRQYASKYPPLIQRPAFPAG